MAARFATTEVNKDLMKSTQSTRTCIDLLGGGYSVEVSDSSLSASGATLNRRVSNL
jgi:hypothetical protein